MAISVFGHGFRGGSDPYPTQLGYLDFGSTFRKPKTQPTRLSISNLKSFAENPPESGA